jgi:riboflavin synthase
MFTGIVEETGTVESVREGEKSIELTVRAKVCARGTKVGDSIAVNGCCLTVVELPGGGPPAPHDLKAHLAGRGAGPASLRFDLLKETWRRTNLQFAKPGALVTLERSLAADGRVHGHFVTGHIDGTGRVDVFEKRGADWHLRVTPPPELMRYIVMKGAIAIDGMSLTVAEVGADWFAIWIIPHTWEITALRERTAGSLVNIEPDMLAKYVERLVCR